MPLEIVRNDIACMEADVIVNTANPEPVIGAGCDAGIHFMAGPGLLEARRLIGSIPEGQAAITPAFSLNAQYVIHAVGPVWRGGSHGESDLLRQCYDRSLALALDSGCKSIAFPLLCAGSNGFPPALALQIAISAISNFLLEQEMLVYLVVFSRDAYQLSEKLFASVSQYIDERYIDEKLCAEYSASPDTAIEIERKRRAFRKNSFAGLLHQQHSSAPSSADQAYIDSIELSCKEISNDEDYSQAADFAPPPMCSMQLPGDNDDLRHLLDKTDAGFSETLLHLIDRTGKKDSEIYKRANVDRKLFSKIRNNPDYRPSKSTSIAFAIALELSLEETRDLISRAGYALTHSSKFDIIIEYFILHGNYNIFEINAALFEFDQNLLGA